MKHFWDRSEVSGLEDPLSLVPLRLFCELDFSGVVENVECYLVWKM